MKTINIYFDNRQVSVDDDSSTLHHFSEYHLEKLEEIGNLSIEDQVKLGRNIYENIFATAKRKERFVNILKNLQSSDHLVLNIRSEEENIHNVPFELINMDGSPAGFLLKQGNISIVRGIPTLDKRIETGTRPVRILVLLSLPLDTYRKAPLNVLKELKTISDPLHPYIQSGLVEIDIEEKVNIPQIKERVLKKRYDIIHFSGHGARGGRLVIEDEEYWEWEKEIDGEQVKDIFQNSGIRLFYFAACETAQTGELESSLAYHIYKNIPTAAVIANLAAVEDTLAAETTKYIYEALFEKQHLGSILNRVRLKLHRDWWKPVAFGDPGQRLFAFDKGVETGAGKKEERILMRGAEPSIHYVYRYGIVRQASALIEEKNYLVLQGIGGAGKSTFANYLSEFYDTRFKHILFFDLKNLGIRKPAELLERMLEELEMYDLIPGQGMETFISSNRSERVLNRQKVEYIEKTLHEKTLLILDNLEETIQDEGGVIKKEWYDLIDFFLNSHTFFTIFTSRLKPYLTARQPLDNLLEIGEYTEMEFNSLVEGLPNDGKEYLERKRDELQNKYGRYPLTISRAIEKKFADISRLFSLQEFKDIFEFYRPYFKRFTGETAILFHQRYPFSDIFMENLFHADFIDLLKNKLLILGKIEDSDIYMVYESIKYYFENDFSLDGSNLNMLAQKTITFFKEGKYHKGDLPNIFDLTAAYYEESKEKSCEATLVDIFEALVPMFEAGPAIIRPIFEKFDVLRNEFSLEEEKKVPLYNSLGKVNRIFGNNEAALEFFKKVVEIKETKMGKTHLSTAFAYSNIAAVYDEMNNNREAMEYYEKALKILETNQGLESINSAIIYINIGKSYYRRDKFEEALTNYQKALNIMNGTGENGNDQIATTYENIGLIYAFREQYQEALENYKRALNIKETANIYLAIAELYYKQNNYREAKEYCRKALGIANNHIKIADIYNILGLIYDEQKRFSKALSYLVEALKIKETYLGENHVDTGSIYNNIAGIYSEQNNNSEALKNYEKALKIFETGLGKNNMDTAATYNNIAVLYGRIGKSSEALDYFKKTLKITETILGNNHSYIASIYNNIGINYESKKQYADALEYFDKALEILEKKNLNSHFPCKNKAQVLYKLANYEKAIEYYHKALTIFKRRKDYFSMFEIYPFLIYSSIKSDSDYAKIAEYFCHFLELFDIYFEKDTPFFRNIGPFFARENILNETVVNKIKEKIPYDVCKDNFDNFVKWIKALSAAVPGLVKTKTPG
ncbi:MAG: tetratricopeptide repeat protein [Acidobacteria bacterium]|nr:tetratricopeptide repeat protein [Acidobacteriota bacterium]